MSLKAVLWAIENEDVFSSSQKFVLIALANFATDQGKSYPAVATICRITKQSDDTVRRCLDALQQDGLIADTGKRFGPTQQVKVWQLPPETWQLKDPQRADLQNGKDPHHAGQEDPRKTRERPAKDPHHAGQTIEPLNKKQIQGADAPTALKRKPEPSWTLPPVLECDSFRAAWAEWLADRKTRRKPVTERAGRLQLEKLAAWGPEKAVQSITASIENGWQGLFEPRNQNGQNKNHQQHIDRSVGTSNENLASNYKGLAKLASSNRAAGTP